MIRNSTVKYMTVRQLTRVVLAGAPRDDDDGPTCHGCASYYRLSSGTEPTPLCHDCAQQAVVKLAKAIARRRRRRR